MNRIWSSLLPVPLLPILLWGCSGEPEGGKGPKDPEDPSGSDEPVIERYDALVTLTSQDCMESSSTGPSESSVVFERSEGAWTVALDDELTLPCEGSDTEFLCTDEIEFDTTTSYVQSHILTLEGTRDAQALEASYRLEATCAEGSTGYCLPCTIEAEVTGTRADE
jgi:hypothetical protein